MSTPVSRFETGVRSAAASLSPLTPPSSRPAPEAPSVPSALPTAIVYCEGNFGAPDGKTANGLVRHSGSYRLLAVIDSGKAGLDAGHVLDGAPNGIPVCAGVDDAIALAGERPDVLIFGMAPATGMLSRDERVLMLGAMARGMGLVNGLHEFLNDDPEFASAAALHGVSIRDVRRPRAKKDLRMFTGRIASVSCPIIAVLGTDCAIGKRTTATILTRALRECGLNAIMIGTGQTGIIQGARYCVALDAIPSQFCSGELEATVVEAFEREHPDVIIVEGQGALSHPAFLTSACILRGSQSDGVILQHAPHRAARCDFPDQPMPTARSEIELIQAFAQTRVIGLTLNHEGMSEADIAAAIVAYERDLGVPVTDALTRPRDALAEMVVCAFPELEERRTLGAA